MSGDNKSLLDPLESQGEDNLENPSPETEGQSLRKNKFSNENSSDANTTSNGDVLSEPTESSEGVKRKEEMPKGDSASGDTKEVHDKESDAVASKCTKPSGENLPKNSSETETEDKKGKKKMDGAPTPIDKESQDVESDKEKKSTDESKRGSSKNANSKKGKGGTQKGDLPDEWSEQVSNDESEEQSESRKEETSDNDAPSNEVGKSTKSKGKNKKPKKGAYSEKKKRDKKRKKKSQAIGASKEGKEDTIEGEKKKKSKEKKSKKSNEGNTKSNTEPTGTNEDGHKKIDEDKGTEIAESQNHLDRDQSRTKHIDNAPRIEDSISSVLPEGSSNEKLLREMVSQSGVQQHDKQSEDGSSTQGSSGDFTESPVENAEQQRLAQDQQLNKGASKGRNSSGLSAEEMAMMPAPRVGRMEAFKGFIARHLNFDEKSKNQKLPSESPGKNTGQAEEDATVTDSQMEMKQRNDEQNQEDGNKPASAQDATTIQVDDKKRAADQKSEENETKTSQDSEKSSGKRATAVRNVILHLFTHHAVTSVVVEFVKPPSNFPKVFRLQQANDSGLYWKSPLLQFPEKGDIEYGYTVHIIQETLKFSPRETRSRHVRWGTNQYDVFHFPSDQTSMQNLFNGQFYFVRLIYQQLVREELSLDRALEEYDSISFGHHNFGDQERVTLYKWIICLQQEGGTCYRSLFICYLLFKFCRRTNCTDQQWYIVGDVADKLVCFMSTWNREEFDRLSHKGIKQAVKESIRYLVMVNSWRWLPFLTWFCHLFDAGFVIGIASELEQLFKDTNLTDHGLMNCVNTVLSKLENLKNVKDVERYVKFLVKRAQSVGILWRLYSLCQEKCPNLAKQELKLFEKMFLKLTGHERHLRYQDVLDAQVWSGVPEALRDELADPFVKSVEERVPYVEKWNQERLNGLWEVMLDTKLQKCKDFAKILHHLAESRFKELNDFTIELLNTPKFAEYWKTVEEDSRCKFLYKLLGSTKGCQARADCGESKNKVLRALKAVSAICETLQLTPCPLFVDSLHKRVMSDLQNSETAEAIDAFVETQKLSQETKENYDRLLHFVVNRDARNGSLLPTLKQMFASPGEPSAEKSEVDALKIDRICEEAILSLLENTKLPPDSKTCDKGEYEEAFDNLSKDEELWIFLLNNSQPSQKVREEQRFGIVAKALAAFLADAESKQLRLGFLQKLKSNVNSVSLLTKLCASFQLCKSYQEPKVFLEEGEVEALISSSMAELNRLHSSLNDLEKAVNFLQRLRDVKLLDTEDVVKYVSIKKKEIPDRRVADILNEEFWGDQEPLLQNAELLSKMFQSLIFQSAAESCLLEEQKGCYSMEDALKRLSDKGIELFSELCRPLFEETDCLYLRNTESLMKAIKTEEELMKELTFVSQLFEEDDVSAEVGDMLKCYLNYPVIQKKVKKLEVILEAFGYEKWQDLNWSLKVKALSGRTRSSYYKLAELSGAVKGVSHIDETLSEDLAIIVSELADSRDLISLLQETAHDDVVIFIDAVEEHSDQTVSESEVSDFIEVHRFLSPLVQDPPHNPDEFLAKLKQRFASLERLVGTGMAAKIKACSCSVHSLRNLYKNLANRGEMTKEIIANALSKGRYQVETNAEKQTFSANWQFKLIYKDMDGSDRTHNMADLQDFRSRALLIVNSETKQQSLAAAGITRESSNVDLQQFIKQVDLLSEITRTGEELQCSGYPKFKRHWWQKLEGTDQIESLATQLETELQNWEELLTRVRNANFYLNFFHPDQLWNLEKFFDGDSCDENTQVVHSLFRYIDPSINVKDLEKFRGCNEKPLKEEVIEAKLVSVGILLDRVFQVQDESDEDQGVPLVRGSPVKPGEVYVAVLDQSSTQTVPVVMSLFNTTTGKFPLPNQILFCHDDTSWDEINLLLRRCFNAHAHSKPCRLHCLANVESLPYDLQFQLVDAIKYYEARSDAPYLLSLICRGGEHHPVANQFPNSKGRLAGMTDAELRHHFSKLCPAVTMVTSNLPGLGKTEVIYEKAAEQEKAIVSFSVSGPLSRRQLVQKLIKLDLREFHCLHIDVAEVDDALLLDTFFFELIVVGMVASQTQLFHIPTRFIFIEVANTLQHWLRDSLTVSKCFNRVHKEWDDYKNLVCSNERASQLQIVCHYLDAYENRILEGEALSLQQLEQRQPLSGTRCQQLLQTHFNPNSDLSFNILESFIGVLADQLRKFSSSPFFRPQNLKDMVEGLHDTRTRLFEALLDVSREFASRSVDACKAVQAKALGDRGDTELHTRNQMSHGRRSAGDMVDRVTGMIQWADSNHLVVMFHTLDAHSVTALFRRLPQVPTKVREVLKSQETMSDEKLQELQQLSQDQLRTKLERIVRTTRNSDGRPEDQSYVLTADNVLKMVLIIQRIRAGIPVIVMGETGCGKTSLIRYLAKTCDVNFRVQNFHAGITEDDIVEFVREQEKEAKENPDDQIWVFLDEINTCEHLGIINDVICHRSLFGIALPTNLVFMAACNPYCLRPQGTITTAGLSGKSTTDEYSKLVYRVHPLPETMIDYVWDYGALNLEDERAYICQMAEDVSSHNMRDLMVELLVKSQEFIRNEDKSRYCVSLRDVRRCIVLAEWFRRKLQERQALPEEGRQKLDEQAKACYDKARTIDKDTRSVVLALAHSYQSRIPTSDTRREYRRMLSDTFRQYGRTKICEDVISKIVRAEQEEYLARMELPEGTARNAALRENVFVILVCILNRLPVFVVGKPGCSKSLSVQVIRSNLRGQDSKDEFFKSLPQLYIVSYQGSESSTSEGILKVFDKACKYKKHNSSDKVLPVVLLDEIGLAEISTYNPLKVLHRLLEPELSEFPEVAVVGISNWALDAAKMNRAIHLSRPEPTLDDLHETGLSIRHAQTKEDNFLETRSGNRYRRPQYSDDNQLRCLAEAYYEYQSKQLRENFHGLRDYYSLIKSLSLADDVMDECQTSQEDVTRTYRVLQRNFGGLPKDNETLNIKKVFTEKASKKEVIEEPQPFPVTDLIRDNLRDKLARHLLLITSGDSAMGIVQLTLQDSDKEKITIFGSKFEEDQSEDYNYRILSRIILYMEKDCVLILKDLESVYGSLYDMLNQNYTVVGGKKNCRVALGPYSNPMCQVHDGFRCIVLIDEGKVDYADPPFLNRFEKQLLRFSDVLTDDQQEVVSSLKAWVHSFSTGTELPSQLDERDVFLGFHEDTLPSLVLKEGARGSSRDSLLKKCKAELMQVATPDGVLRSLKSELAATEMLEISRLYKTYFNKPTHNGLREFLETSMKQNPSQTQNSEEGGSYILGKKLLVMTHANIHTDVTKCLDGFVQCQSERLSSFKSEKQLTKQIQHFWREPGSELLVIQCNAEMDADHMLLMKSTIENHREEYFKSIKNKNRRSEKHVCIIVHVERQEERRITKGHSWQFNFLSGWEQATVDALEPPSVAIESLLDKSVPTLLTEETLQFQKIAADQLLWCFTRLKYPLQNEPSLKETTELVSKIKSSKSTMSLLEKLVLRCIQKDEGIPEEALESFIDTPKVGSWQVKVACDQKALLTSSTLVAAMLHYVTSLVRCPLAKVVYSIENGLTWNSCLDALEQVKQVSSSRGSMRSVWAELLCDEQMFSVDEIPDPQGAQSYIISSSACQAQYPFSSTFCRKIESTRDRFAREYRSLELEDENVDEEGELTDEAIGCLLKRFSEVVETKVPQMLQKESLRENIMLYIEDILDAKSAEFIKLSRDDRISLLKAACNEYMKLETQGDLTLTLMQLHYVLWQHEGAVMGALQLAASSQIFFELDIKGLTDPFVKCFDAKCLQDKESISSNFVQRREWDQLARESNSLSGTDEHRTVASRIDGENDDEAEEEEEDTEGTEEDSDSDNDSETDEDESDEDESIEDSGDENETDEEDDESDDLDEDESSDEESNIDGNDDDDDEEEEEEEDSDDGKEEDGENSDDGSNDQREGEDGSSHDENASDEDCDDNEDGQNNGDNEEQRSEEEGVEDDEKEERQEKSRKETEDALSKKKETKKDSDVIDNDEQNASDTFKKYSRENDDDVASTGDRSLESQDKEDRAKQQEKGKADPQVLDQSFVELIVDICCTKLYPTDKVITVLGNPATWQRATSVVISMVTKLRLHQPPSFHFLRVCEDFANTVYSHNPTEPPYPLYVLGALGQTSVDVNSRELFDQICELVEGQQDKESEDGRRFQKFLVHFFLRCISADPDTPLLDGMMRKLCSLTENELLKYASPVLHRILMAEESETFEAILDDADVIQDCQNLRYIDQALNSVIIEEHSLPLDCPFAVMCCDIIGHVAFQDLSLRVVTKSDDPVVERMHKAISLVNDVNHCGTNMFRFLVAVAYLRAFLSSVAAAILQDTSCLQREGDTCMSMLLRHVSAVLDTPTLEKCANPSKSICTLFLLRELRKALSMFELRRLCESATIMPLLKSIPWARQGSPVAFSSSKNTDKMTAEAALVDLVKRHNKEKMTKFCSSLRSSANLRKSFAVVLIENFYLKRAIRNLGDTEDKVVEVIMNELPKLPLSFRKLLDCVGGKEDFHVPGLKISPESPAGSVQKAALILHLATLLTAEFTDSKPADCLFLSLIQQPENCAKSFMPGAPTTFTTSGQRNFELCGPEILNGASLFHCTCAVLYATTSPECHCSRCKSKCAPFQDIEPVLAQAASGGYVPVHASQICSESFRVRDMTPVSFRVLHLFVHSALYAGVALNMFSDSQLAKFLALENTGQDAAQECFLHIVNDLDVLSCLLAWSEERVINWLHQVIEETSQHLVQCRKDVACLTNQSRKQWEATFTDTVEAVLRDNATRAQEMSNEKEALDCGGSIEDQIEERDSSGVAVEAMQRNLHIPRFFRSTKPKSLDDLKAQYYLATEKQKRNHPLLGLFLDNLTTLPYVSELYPLINWSRMLEASLAHRLSRNSAEKTTIDDVIRDEHAPGDATDSGQSRREDAFAKFKASWQKVKHLVEQKLGLDENVPYITELLPVSVCLVDSKGSGRHLCTALQILQNMQNEFQEKVLKLAAQCECAALDFLKRSDGLSSLAVIRLQDVREKEVISYQWTDDILFHSHHDTDYGHGQEIIYDFGKIERELAGRFLLGKVYFSATEELREFTYSNELFHTCANVLNELGAYVRQEPLNESHRSGLDRLKKGSLKTVQDLLEHLEVVVCLLKTTGASDNTVPLEEYTDRWLSSSRPFPKALLPEPSIEFQLRHVVALYEGLEDLLAEPAADTLRDAYRISLPHDPKMITECASANEESALCAVVTALRRFIFRYLLSDKFQPDPAQNAAWYLRDPSLWPMEVEGPEGAATSCDESTSSLVQRARKFLPEDLVVRHVYALMKHYRDIIKTQEEKRAQTRGALGRKIGFRPQKKRKLAVTFG